jgi:DNA-binding response OmpR family regulator
VAQDGDDARRTRVLLVEDSEDARELYELAFRAEGLDIRTAPSVDEALVIALEWSADVVVTDLMMPRRDGFDLLRALRAAGQTMPAILFSGRTGPGQHAKAVAAGFQEHLPKPCAVDLLIARVRWVGSAARRAWSAVAHEAERVPRQHAVVIDRTTEHACARSRKEGFRSLALNKSTDRSTDT